MDRTALRISTIRAVPQQQHLTLRFLVYEDEEGNLLTVRPDPPPPAPGLGLEPKVA